MKKKNKKLGFHPVMTYIIIMFVIIGLSFILSLFNTQSTYGIFSTISRDYKITSESVLSLLNLRGIKYIFTTTVANFANFAVLPNLIIILIGIGVMDKSGYLKTLITILTKKAQKRTVTFVLVFLAIISSIIGDLSFLIFIPLSALIFYYGKRNPMIGIVSSFAALSVGNGLSLLFTSVDSSLRDITLLNASVYDPKYHFGIYAMILINVILIIAAAFIITHVTENYIVKKLPEYEFEEEEEEVKIAKKEYRGLLLASFVGVIYLLIIIYNIIPGLPLSGNLLDYGQTLYIDKLFSYESFFTLGFVFIVALLFILLGLFYGIGAKTINNNKDLVDSMSSSLNGIGKTLLLIFVAASLINIFKQTNIGPTIVAWLSNSIKDSNFTSIPLLIMLFVVSAISTLVLPRSASKWAIIASTAVPAFMNAGLSPEFSQLIFRLGESVTMGLTPILASYVIYLAYIEKYNQDEKPINLFTTIKYQLPYAGLIAGLYIFAIILWYLATAGIMDIFILYA